MSSFIDIAGQRFGSWTVISRSTKLPRTRSRKEAMWNCRCDCGNTGVVRGSYLRKGKSKSCGCKAVEFYRDAIFGRPRRSDAKQKPAPKSRRMPIGQSRIPEHLLRGPIRDDEQAAIDAYLEGGNSITRIEQGEFADVLRLTLYPKNAVAPAVRARREREMVSQEG